MATTYKSVALLRDLVDELKKEVAAVASFEVDSFDSNSNPVATFSHSSTITAGEANVVIRVQPLGNYPTYSSSNPQGGPPALDSLGNPANQYAHHVIEVCTEANPSSGSGADTAAPSLLLPVLAAAAKRGTQVKWYQTANGVVPSAAGMTAANLKATYDSLYWTPLATV